MSKQILSQSPDKADIQMLDSNNNLFLKQINRPNFQVDPTMVISHRFGMTDWQNAFHHLMSGSACKIVVDPQL